MQATTISEGEMTKADKSLIMNLIDEILEYLSSLEEICELPTDEFLSDRRNPYALRYLLIVIVESLAKISVSILESIGNDLLLRR